MYTYTICLVYLHGPAAAYLENPVLHFHMLQNKLNPICRNSDDLHQKTLRTRKTMTRIEYVPLHLRPSLPKDTKPAQTQNSQQTYVCVGTIRQTQILENLGPVQVLCTLSNRILENLGFVHEFYTCVQKAHKTRAAHA